MVMDSWLRYYYEVLPQKWFSLLMISQLLSLLSCRRCSLEKKLADADVSEEEVNNILKQFEKKETEYMRLQRHKMSVDDFDLLTMIGKGAFGEVIHKYVTILYPIISILFEC